MQRGHDLTPAVLAVVLAAACGNSNDIATTRVHDGGADRDGDTATSTGGSGATEAGGTGGSPSSGGTGGTATGGAAGAMADAAPDRDSAIADANGTGGADGGRDAGGSGGSADSGPMVCWEQGDPVEGTWTEVARLDCLGGETVPDQPIREVVFASNRDLSVTWSPFETYYDYWGSYTLTSIDGGRGSIHLTVDGGNYVPDDIEPHGTFERCGDELILRDLWLGSAQYDSQTPPACGHRFRPY